MDDSDNKRPDTPAEDPPAADTARDGESGAGETAAAACEAPWAEGAEDALQALQTENEKLKDQLLRALAEMENLRNRTARELRDARAYAIANFARDVLDVGDNLRRAMEALPDSAPAAGDPALAALREGVEMTERDLQRILEKHQVKRIDPTGERFDPHFHQAMFEVPDDKVANGTVVEVVQAGYVIGERMLRPALVGVSKGGPKPAAKAEPEADEAPGQDAEPQARKAGAPDAGANDNQAGAKPDNGA